MYAIAPASRSSRTTWRLVSRENHHAGAGRASGDLTDRLPRASAGHLDVDEGSVGSVLLGVLNRLGRALREGDDTEVSLELGAEHGAHDLVVVGDEQARTTACSNGAEFRCLTERDAALAAYDAKADELADGRWIWTTAGGWNVNQLDTPQIFTFD